MSHNACERSSALKNFRDTLYEYGERIEGNFFPMDNFEFLSMTERSSENIKIRSLENFERGKVNDPVYESIRDVSLGCFATDF
jgi:hypothetical protein